MKNILSAILLSLTLLSSAQKFELDDFYGNKKQLIRAVDSIYQSLTDTSRVGQMIVTSYGHNGKSKEEIEPLIIAHKIGGIIYLKGTHQEHLNNTIRLNKLNNNLPLLYSMDAEPSLMRGRISTLSPLPKTIELQHNKLNDSVATLISNELNSIGVKLNFAPVCDLSTSNKAIKSRSYGDNIDTVISKSNSFINSSYQNNIVSCAKHFPGHGLVKGDSHHERVFIDGELKELPVYEKLVNNPKLLTVMVGHIDILNNSKYQTNNTPSSCSRLIVTQLLKEELNFKGLVITDALGMKALKEFETPGLNASMAGCDLLCMPKDENKLIRAILLETSTNEAYAQQIEQSIKKIIRLKLCLNLFKTEPKKKIILYQHGRIVEEQGTNAVSPIYGNYEFDSIVNSFKNEGYEVIATVRANNASVEASAIQLAQQVDSLVLEGYNTEDITLIGASKGAGITLLASTKISFNTVNIIVLAICGDELYKYYQDNQLTLKGKILSIYEASDEWGKSCAKMNYGSDIQNFQEIQLNTKLKHGIVYRPLSEWIYPSIMWIESNGEAEF